MAFDEDLTPFFNPDEFAVSATIKTPAGVVVRTANVILSTPVQEMAVGAGAEVAHLQPSLQCRTVDLAGVKKEYIVEVGSAVFRIVRHEADGTGVSVAFLRKQ